MLALWEFFWSWPAPISANASVMVAGSANQRSSAAISGTATAEIQARAASTSTSALTGRADSAVTARAAPTVSFAASVRAKIMMAARSSPSASAALAALVKATVSAQALLSPSANISGRTSVAVKAFAATLYGLAIAGRSSVAAQARALATGTASLFGLTGAQVKGQSVVTLKPVIISNAGDIIAVAVPFGGDVSAVPFSGRFALNRAGLYVRGADIAFGAGVDLSEVSSLSLVLTGPGGLQLNVSSNLYVGRRDMATVMGVFRAGTYVICKLPPNVLVPGAWTTQLGYEINGVFMLSATGNFTV